MPDFWSRPLRASPDALHQELSGETVLLNLKTEHYFGLDEVGTRIWQLIVAESTPEAIVLTLLEEYDVEAERVRADVERLVGELEAAGLLASG
ncbi:MAG: PqqD family protein [Casimicrobiaceae bacterium]